MAPAAASSKTLDVGSLIAHRQRACYPDTESRRAALRVASLCDNIGAQGPRLGRSDEQNLSKTPEYSFGKWADLAMLAYSGGRESHQRRVPNTMSPLGFGRNR